MRPFFIKDDLSSSRGFSFINTPCSFMFFHSTSFFSLFHRFPSFSRFARFFFDGFFFLLWLFSRYRIVSGLVVYLPYEEVVLSTRQQAGQICHRVPRASEAEIIGLRFLLET
jgi:hypothetical protein